VSPVATTSRSIPLPSFDQEKEDMIIKIEVMRPTRKTLKSYFTFSSPLDFLNNIAKPYECYKYGYETFFYSFSLE